VFVFNFLLLFLKYFFFLFECVLKNYGLFKRQLYLYDRFNRNDTLCFLIAKKRVRVMKLVMLL